MAIKKFKSLPYFKFDVNSWLVSTRGMDWEVKGFYIDLLALCWNNQVICGIVADHREMIRLLSVGNRRTFDRLWAVIRPKFELTKVDGVEYYVNMRLLREREQLVDVQDVRAEAARRKHELMQSNSSAIAECLQGHLDNSREEKSIVHKSDEPTAPATTTRSSATKSPKALHHMFRATWQSKKGPAAVCRLPVGDKMAPWWKEVCESHPAWLLERAFELWVDERGARITTDNPIYDFLRAPYGEWLEKVDPTKKFSNKGDIAASMAAYKNAFSLAKTTEETVPLDPMEALS